ncbi:MAG: hypothetical protein KYQ20_01230 [Candidatus Nealsonbacteria bacterium]|nr:hypothetical protein [Candidatus Nealsonbacteria bacterium]
MEEKIEQGQLIGRISHYFGNIGVAVIGLFKPVKIGDTLRIVGGETDFTQIIESMEVDHKKVEEAKKGDSVGFKITQKVREGYKVYKL